MNFELGRIFFGGISGQPFDQLDSRSLLGVEAAVAAERERCAKIADSFIGKAHPKWWTIAERIRSGEAA